MIFEVKTFRVKCDRCGYDHTFQAPHSKLPDGWKRVSWSDDKGYGYIEKDLCEICAEKYMTDKKLWEEINAQR